MNAADGSIAGVPYGKGSFRHEAQLAGGGFALVNMHQDSLVPPAEAPAVGSAEGSAASALPIDRKVIHTADLALNVVGRDQARERVEQIMAAHQGVLANSTLERIVFRVPPDQFEQVLRQLEQIGEVVSRAVNSQDVTADYQDIALRLDVAEASRQRLIALLERAGDLADVLKVEQDIRRLTEEIESLKGRARMMQDQVDLATITVTLIEKIMVENPRRHRSDAIFDWVNATDLQQTLRDLPGDAPLKGGVWYRRMWGPLFALATDNDAPLPAGLVPVLYERRESARRPKTIACACARSSCVRRRNCHSGRKRWRLS